MTNFALHVGLTVCTHPSSTSSNSQEELGTALLTLSEALEARIQEVQKRVYDQDGPALLVDNDSDYKLYIQVLSWPERQRDHAGS